MSRTERRVPRRRNQARRACWLDCIVCYRRGGLTIGDALERLRRKKAEAVRREVINDAYLASMPSFSRSWGNPEDSIYDR